MHSTTIQSEAALAGGSRVQDFFKLLKPRVMSLVVFTGIVGLLLAPGTLHPVLAGVALLCIAVGAGAAGAINMWYDRDIDAKMQRTRARPLPMGRIVPDEALGFGVVLAMGAVAMMGLAVNWVAAGLLALTIAFYVFVYTMWLKRRTPQNIVIGGGGGRLSADDWLGGGDRRRKPKPACPLRHHLPMDAAAFLGAVALPKR